MEKENLFNVLLQDIKGTFIQTRKEYYGGLKDKAMYLSNKTYKDVKSSLEKEYGQYIYHENITANIITNMLVSNSESTSNESIMVLRNDIESYISKLIKEDTKNMFQSFIRKQTEKTDNILKGRCAAIEGKVVPNTLECHLKFKLEDRSYFEMKCQIKTNYSSLGNPYYQFPTTFHNAILKDGTKIKKPSESKLKKLL